MKTILIILFLLFSSVYSSVSVCDIDDTAVEMLCEESSPQKQCGDMPSDEKECLGVNDRIDLLLPKTYIVPMLRTYALYVYDKRKRKPPRTFL